ncbi:MAG: hypothetical protein Q9174_002595, partial [Haloplaca sp. 1 TL-2023]
MLFTNRIFKPHLGQYREIDDNDSSSSDEKDHLSEISIQTQKSPNRRLNFAVIAATAVLGIILISASFSYYVFASSTTTAHSHSFSNSPCGNSSAEALAHGCTFDQLTWAWLPPYCPHYANDDFIAAAQTLDHAPWRYYIDPRKRTPATGPDWTRVLDNEIPVYTEKREHLSHCVFLYLGLGQIIREMERGEDSVRYSPKQVDYGHLIHCKDVLLTALKKGSTAEEGEGWDDVQTMAPNV